MRFPRDGNSSESDLMSFRSRGGTRAHWRRYARDSRCQATGSRRCAECAYYSSHTHHGRQAARPPAVLCELVNKLGTALSHRVLTSVLWERRGTALNTGTVVLITTNCHKDPNSSWASILRDGLLRADHLYLPQWALAHPNIHPPFRPDYRVVYGWAHALSLTRPTRNTPI
jgi:hypothetical protein